MPKLIPGSSPDKAAATAESLPLALLLLAATVVFIFSLPAAEDLPVFVRLCRSAMLVAAVLVCATSRRLAWIAVLLGLPAAVLSWLAEYRMLDAWTGAAAVFQSALLLYVFTLMLRRLFVAGRVTPVTIVLAVNAYLMMAVVWAVIFVAVELAQPGSFSCCSDGVREPGWQGELLYFSFVTIATLGYGDILPLAPFARSLAMMEAVVGTMFLAIIIAGLLNRSSRPTH